MSVETAEELWIDELKDIDSAETQAVSGYPGLTRAVQSEELKSAPEDEQEDEDDEDQDEDVDEDEDDEDDEDEDDEDEDLEEVRPASKSSSQSKAAKKAKR